MEGTGKKRATMEVYPPRDGSKTIVVLGVERGGTSMVAGVIRALGVNMGERAGRNHENAAFLSDDQEKLRNQIKKHNEENDVWGFKVPKASLMVDFYAKNLRNPHFVLVFRNIGSVVDSWCSRGANDPIETAKHSLKYYSAALDSLNNTGFPLMYVNYERACEQKNDFINSIAGFIGIDPDEEIKEKAVSVITGEGGGYLDLPEFYFNISALEPSAGLNEELMLASIDENEFEKNLARKPGERLVFSPQEEFLPDEFYVSLNLDGEQQFFEENGLRVYLDFKEKLFPGHAFRPEIHKGKNVIRILTNGNARRIAFGGLRKDAVFSVSDVIFYRQSDTEKTIQPGRQQDHRVASRKGRMMSIYNKIRKKFV